MEQRKLIRLGNSSFAISLPKNWIEKSGLKKGDDVFITPNSNGELIIQPELKAMNDTKKITINLENKDEASVKRDINAAYARGYNLFEFSGGKNFKIKNIKKIVDGLLSLEVLNDKENNILVKDFFSLEDANQENFIRRIDNNLREMLATLKEFLKKKRKTPDMKEIDEIDRDINKFYLLSTRFMFRGLDNPAVLTNLKTDSITLFNNWWLSFNLEKVGDDIKAINRIINPVKDRNSLSKIAQLIEEIETQYINSLESFYREDKELAKKIISETKAIMKKYEKLNKDNSVVSKVIIKLEEVRKALYQIAKMVLYSRY